jgi:Tfp pilus assembly protein PilV
METYKNKKAFTLLELMIAAVSLAVIVVGVGAALYHAQRSWMTTYDKVHGDMTTDAFVAKGAFDSVVRKSSLEAKKPMLGNDGKAIELYYYRFPASPNIDGYALFHLEGNDLVVTYGQLAKNTQIELRKDTLVRNVKDLKFTVDGANVRMVLTIADQAKTMNVTASAVRHTS